MLSKEAGVERLARTDLTPRGLDRDQAAAYLGISPTLFDKLVARGHMPRPRQIGGRRVWDRHELDSAFSALPHDDGTPGTDATTDVWSRVAP
jgi:predicted DNA-binding transcriptional regulator AlpA